MSGLLKITAMRPSVNRILVEPIKPPKDVIAGVEVDTKDPKIEGIILGVGPGVVIEKLGLEPGMTVTFGQYAGEDITIEGKLLKVLFVDETIESELLGYDDNRK